MVATLLTSRLARFASFTVVLAVILAIVMGCAATHTHQGYPKDKLSSRANQPETDVLSEALSDNIVSLDPIHLANSAAVEVASAIHRGLVTLSADGVVVPAVASNWVRSDDGLQYTFTLRKNVKFQDGTLVTSDDVVYSLTRLLDPKNHASDAWMLRTLIAGADAYVRGQASSISGIRAVDSETIAITLRAPAGLIVKLLAMPYCAIVPRHQVEAMPGDGFGKHPIGAGPYTLTNWSTDELQLKRSTHYWLTPQLSGLMIHLGVPESVAVREWKDHRVDLITPQGVTLSPATISSLQADKLSRGLVHASTENAVAYTGMNVQVKPFDQVGVRKAMNMAIDRSAIIQAIGGRGQAATGILPPRMEGFDPSRIGIPYDPERAKELLASAGYPHGFSATLWTPSDASSVAVAKVVQTNLAAVGVAIIVKAVSMNELLTAVTQPSNVALYELAWMQDNPDPDNFLGTLFHSANVGPYNASWYVNHHVDGELEGAKALPDGEARGKVYQRIETEILADVPWIPEYWPVSTALTQKYVHGYTIPVIGGTCFDDLTMSAH